VHPDQQPKADPFYGNQAIASLCARFISHLFTCPELPPATSQSQQRLPAFIAYALHRTKLHSSVAITALILLNRLKIRFPTARGSSGHRLFISAFMLASKVMCDDTYSNKSWSIVAQGMFNLREINQMEREMCAYLEWELHVDGPMLKNFESLVQRDFSMQKDSYPVYPADIVSRRARKAGNTMPESSTSPIPNFGAHRKPAPSKPTPSSSPVSGSSSSSYPNTPDASHSQTSSPASSASPATPVGPDGPSPAVFSDFDTSPGFMISDIGHTTLKTQTFSQVVPSQW
jgi:hypothetical protein